MFGTGTYDSIYWLYPPMYMHDGCYLEEASILKNAVNIPVICPGKLSDPEMANNAIRDGLIDALSVGRGLVADPYWPNKVKSGQVDEIRPCIYCNNGCLARVLSGSDMRCAVNPDVFCELDTSEKYRQVDIKKDIAIIGGGIAGLEAARVAAIRGHKVTVYEAGDKLGGLMLPGEVPEFKKKDALLLDWHKRQMDKLGVKIKLNSILDENDILKLKADEIIFATGSTARSLPVPGGDGDNVMTAAEALLEEKVPGKKVVMVGGGQVGCETAIWLKDRGHDVSVVESRDALILGSGDPIPQPNRDMLLELLIYKEIPVYLSTRVKEVREKEVVIEGEKGTETLDADSVVISIGYKSNDQLYKKVYSQSDKKVWLVGDAQVPATIMTAIRDGSAIGAIV